MANIARIPYEATSGAEIDDTIDDVVNESASGISGRLTVRRKVIRTFNLTLSPIHEPGEVRAIYRTHRKRWPVGVRDWAGYSAQGDGYSYTLEVLDYTQDATTTYAPLRRIIQPSTGDRYQYERILIPDEDEVSTEVYINGVHLSRVYWSFTDFGIVTIPNSFVTGSPAATITASGRYLVAACFMDASLTSKVLMDGQFSLPTVMLREILEDELVALMAQTDDSA